MNALGEQFTDVTASVVDDLAHDRRLAAVDVVVLEEGGPAHFDFDLQLHA